MKPTVRRLFFEITEEKRGDYEGVSLWLYGKPISRIDIWFSPRKKTRFVFCHHCKQWQQKPLIFPWATSTAGTPSVRSASTKALKRTTTGSGSVRTAVPGDRFTFRLKFGATKNRFESFRTEPFLRNEGRRG